MTAPAWATAWLLADESGVPAVALLTLTAPEWAAPIRLVRDTADLVSRGDTFRAAYFEIDVVSDDDQPPRASLSIPNVTRDVGLLALQLLGPPKVTLEVVSAAAPDTPVFRAAHLELRTINMTATTVSGELAVRDYASEICGTIRVIPALFPALWRRRA